MRVTILFATLVAGCTTPAPPTPTDDLGWLVGTWTHTDAAYPVTEAWHAQPDGSLLGLGWARGERTYVFAEAMAIQDGPDGRRYTAWPVDQQPVAFPFVAADGTHFEVSNPGHDFPQRLVYTRADMASLDVLAEGVDAEGAPRVERWSLSKVP